MYRLSAFNLSITTSQHLLFIHPASDARSFFISASVHQAPPPLCAVQTVQSLDSLRRKWITLEERRRDCLTDSKSERGRGKSQSGLEWQSGIKKPAVMCDVTPPIQHTHTHTHVCTWIHPNNHMWCILFCFIDPHCHHKHTPALTVGREQMWIHTPLKIDPNKML